MVSPCHLKLRVLADDLRSEEARFIVPLDSVPVPGKQDQIYHLIRFHLYVNQKFSRMHVSMDIEASILVPIPVLVVVDGKAGLIIELLKAIDGEATRVFHIVQLAGFEAFVVVRLPLASLPSPVEESPD